MLDWLFDRETLLWWLGILSVVTFVGSLILVPVLIVRIPADYFLAEEARRAERVRRHPVVHAIVLIVRTLLGVLLILAGVAMLALPGQGLVTILLGLMLIDFPGKHEFLLRILSKPRVLRAINRIRAKADRSPLQIDEGLVSKMPMKNGDNR